MKEHQPSGNHNNEIYLVGSLIEVIQTELSKKFSPFDTKIVLIRPGIDQQTIFPHEFHNENNLEEVKESLHTKNWKGKPIAAFGLNQGLFQKLPVGVSYLPNLSENQLIVADGTHRLEAVRRLNLWATQLELPYQPFPIIPVQIINTDTRYIQIGSWNNLEEHSIEEITEIVAKGGRMVAKATKFMVKYPESEYVFPEDKFIDDNIPIISNQISKGSLLRVRAIQPDIIISRDQMVALDQCIRLVSSMLNPGYNKAIHIADID